MATPTSVKPRLSEVERNEDLQRFAELGRLSASLLHEISGPLTAALISLEQMGDQPSYGIRSVKRSLVHLTRYVDAARQQLKNESDLSSFYVDHQIRDVKRLVLPLAKTAGVTLNLENVPHIKLMGNPIKFQQIIVNLIVNAIEAYPDDSTNSPRIVKVRFSQNNRFTTIEVIDWGEGIAKDRLTKLFEAFYTTKARSGKGLGLGLVVVKRNIEQNFAGRIKVTSGPISGTRFIVKLPWKA